MTRSTPTTLGATRLELAPDVPICQTDLPLDWYQPEFQAYAEEYLALPDRTPESVLPWLDRYVVPALDHFGDALLLVAHFYMGGEIVKLVERYGGAVGDSYQLALQAVRRPEKKVIVESAVHFMAESIAILANADQDVWITNPKAGCTMELLAKDWMVLPIADQLQERYGDDLVCVAYMNTSGRLKALAGRTGGAVCTSANADKVVAWARRAGKKVLFVPDQHLGRNVADKLGLPDSALATLPDPQVFQGNYKVGENGQGDWDDLDRAAMILWGSFCGVHTVFKPAQVEWWQEHGYEVHVHPESPVEVVRAADGAGSTTYLWNLVLDAPQGARLAIGTEGHFVRNAKALAAQRGVEVVHVAEVPDERLRVSGCGCATMSRNDPPHLAGMLDLLRKGQAPDLNKVLAGDIVDERTAARERLDASERTELIRDAKLSLERMIAVTEGS